MDISLGPDSTMGRGWAPLRVGSVSGPPHRDGRVLRRHLYFPATQ